MQTRIPDMRIERLKAATYQELMRDVYETLRQNPDAAQYVAKLLATLKSQLDELNTALGESRKSQYTAQIAQKDTQRDSALVMGKTLIHNTAVNGTGEARDAAIFLEEMAKLPKVKVTPQYDQQTGEINVAVDELLGKYLEYTEAAGVKAQIEQLKRLNDEMCELLILRDTERGEQGKSRVPEIRKRLDVTYRTIILSVNSLDIAYQLGQLNGEPATNPFEDFIAFMLGIIERFKREILKSGGSNGSEVVEEEEVEEVEGETGTDTPGSGTPPTTDDENNDSTGDNDSNNGSDNGATPPEQENPNQPPPPTGGGESGFDW